ncbi:MAG: 3-oxoadipyl-CoA thiolase [Devosia sp.]|nr:3-oxoadipyl-CoA thiolase [Devosia sp.]
MREAFICAGVRTPIGRFGGALASVRPDDMLGLVLAEVLKRAPGLDPAAIDDVFTGCANQAGEDNRNVARMGVLLAGLPQEIPGTTINRLCGSGLDAVGLAARSIIAGDAEVIIASGVESMTRAPFVMPKATSAFSRSAEIHDTTIGWRFVNAALKRRYGIDSMPETAENIAERFKIGREEQDAFAFRSQQRTLAAQAGGVFDAEITPVTIPQRKGEAICVDRDEHPRATSLEKLAALPTPFREGGSITAGNASGVNDGAAALILASADAVRRFGLTPLARVTGMAASGVEPAIMGMGPVPASQKLMDRLGLSIADFSRIELNEAFAAQAIACLRGLGLPDDAPQVNPNGGAIALGHPLGMSGARLALTAALGLARAGEGRALCTMCIGVGQGIALALEAA